MAIYKHRRSFDSDPNSKPSARELEVGEIAINMFNRSLWTKNEAGDIVRLDRADSEIETIISGQAVNLTDIVGFRELNDSEGSIEFINRAGDPITTSINTNTYVVDQVSASDSSADGAAVNKKYLDDRLIGVTGGALQLDDTIITNRILNNPIFTAVTTTPAELTAAQVPVYSTINIESDRLTRIESERMDSESRIDGRVDKLFSGVNPEFINRIAGSSLSANNDLTTMSNRVHQLITDVNTLDALFESGGGVDSRLDGFDTIISTHTTDIGTAQNAADAAQNSSNAVASRVDSEVIDRRQGDMALRSALESEIGFRDTGDMALRSALESDIEFRVLLRTSLESEIGFRDAGDALLRSALESDIEFNAALRVSLESEIGFRDAGDMALRTSLESDIAFNAALRVSLESEIGFRTQDEMVLRTSLESEIGFRTQDDAALRTALESEIGFRVQDELVLRTSLESEIGFRVQADADLRTGLESEIGFRDAGDSELARRLNVIETQGGGNTRADWDVTASTDQAFIENKPAPLFGTGITDAGKVLTVNTDNTTFNWATPATQYVDSDARNALSIDHVVNDSISYNDSENARQTFSIAGKQDVPATGRTFLNVDSNLPTNTAIKYELAVDTNGNFSVVTAIDNDSDDSLLTSEQVIAIIESDIDLDLGVNATINTIPIASQTYVNNQIGAAITGDSDFEVISHAELDSELRLLTNRFDSDVDGTIDGRVKPFARYTSARIMESDIADGAINKDKLSAVDGLGAQVLTLAESDSETLVWSPAVTASQVRAVFDNSGAEIEVKAGSVDSENTLTIDLLPGLKTRLALDASPLSTRPFAIQNEINATQLVVESEAGEAQSGRYLRVGTGNGAEPAQWIDIATDVRGIIEDNNLSLDRALTVTGKTTTTGLLTANAGVLGDVRSTTRPITTKTFQIFNIDTSTAFDVGGTFTENPGGTNIEVVIIEDITGPLFSNISLNGLRINIADLSNTTEFVDAITGITQPSLEYYEFNKLSDNSFEIVVDDPDDLISGTTLRLRVANDRVGEARFLLNGDVDAIATVVNDQDVLVADYAGTTYSTTATADGVIGRRLATGVPEYSLINIDSDIPFQGNAQTATQLRDPITIRLESEVTGSVVFDGSGDVSITTMISANTVALTEINASSPGASRILTIDDTGTGALVWRDPTAVVSGTVDLAAISATGAEDPLSVLRIDAAGTALEWAADVDRSDSEIRILAREVVDSEHNFLESDIIQTRINIAQEDANAKRIQGTAIPAPTTDGTVPVYNSAGGGSIEWLNRDVITVGVVRGHIETSDDIEVGLFDDSDSDEDEIRFSIRDSVITPARLSDEVKDPLSGIGSGFILSPQDMTTVSYNQLNVAGDNFQRDDGTGSLDLSKLKNTNADARYVRGIEVHGTPTDNQVMVFDSESDVILWEPKATPLTSATLVPLFTRGDLIAVDSDSEVLFIIDPNVLSSAGVQLDNFGTSFDTTGDKIELSNLAIVETDSEVIIESTKELAEIKFRHTNAVLAQDYGFDFRDTGSTITPGFTFPDAAVNILPDSDLVNFHSASTTATIVYKFAGITNSETFSAPMNPLGVGPNTFRVLGRDTLSVLRINSNAINPLSGVSTSLFTSSGIYINMDPSDTSSNNIVVGRDIVPSVTDSDRIFETISISIDHPTFGTRTILDYTETNRGADSTITGTPLYSITANNPDILNINNNNGVVDITANVFTNFNVNASPEIGQIIIDTIGVVYEAESLLLVETLNNAVRRITLNAGFGGTGTSNRASSILFNADAILSSTDTEILVVDIFNGQGYTPQNITIESDDTKLTLTDKVVDALVALTRGDATQFPIYNFNEQSDDLARVVIEAGAEDLFDNITLNGILLRDFATANISDRVVVDFYAGGSIGTGINNDNASFARAIANILNGLYDFDSEADQFTTSQNFIESNTNISAVGTFIGISTSRLIADANDIAIYINSTNTNIDLNIRESDSIVITASGLLEASAVTGTNGITLSVAPQNIINIVDNEIEDRLSTVDFDINNEGTITLADQTLQNLSDVAALIANENANIRALRGVTIPEFVTTPDGNSVLKYNKASNTFAWDEESVVNVDVVNGHLAAGDGVVLTLADSTDSDSDLEIIISVSDDVVQDSLADIDYGPIVGSVNTFTVFAMSAGDIDLGGIRSPRSGYDFGQI